MPPTKLQLRKTISDQRKALDFQWVENASSAIVTRFQTLEKFQSAEIIALYKAIGGEVSLESLFSKAWKLGKRTGIPVFNEITRHYELAEITADTKFRTGHYGIKEPIAPSLLESSEIDLIAVPGVGFDSEGNRLGRGGGYYDRILTKFCGTSIGIAFDFQLFPNIPCENHDKPVDFVITETKLLKALNER